MTDARAYHERTKHSPRSIRESDFTLDEANRPRPDKHYLDVERIDLPEADPTERPALVTIAQPAAQPTGDDTVGSVGLETLASLCHESSGVVQRAHIRGEEVLFRAASCTGKLYHIDLYPVTGDVEGLPAGVYHFDPHEGTLDMLREGDYRGALADAVGTASTSGVEEAPVTFVATSTWWRNAWKYRERTYRHAFWDGGTVIANLLASAHGQGRRAEVVAGFEDGLVTRLLGLDPATEAPIALVPIGSGDVVETRQTVDPIDYETAPLSSDPIAYPLIVDAWRQSQLVDADAVDAWHEAATAQRRIGRQQLEAGGDAVELSPVDGATASARPLYATIERRGSKRTFAQEGPSRRQVGTVLDRALVGVPADWNGGEASGLTFNDVYLLATDVVGLDDARYVIHPDSAAATPIGPVDRATKTRLALQQDWAGEAHANVYLLTDVDAVVETLGNRGYRAAQLEAGVTLGRLYLAAFAHRPLGGTGLTFFDDHVTEALSPAAAGQTPTCMFGFGRLPDER
ncbi:MAG: SagB family peptide dehydrogenase [Halobacteriota archaeon]